jgi:hypothetical protein
MKNLIHAPALLGALLILVFLAGCSSTPTPTSTTPPLPDLNPFRTEVAATVLAQVSQTLAAMPTETPIPSPSATRAPTSTPTRPSPEGTEAPAGETPPAETTAVVTPTVETTNLAQWVSQSIDDDATFEPLEVFTITWRIKNVGDSTWTAAYLLRFYSGSAFGAPSELTLGRAVNPGETVDLTLRMQAPPAPGDYRTDWVLSTDRRYNFKDPVYLKIKVVNSATPTPPAAPLPSPTATP